MFGSLKKSATKRLLELLQSQEAMKVMSNERIMNAVFKAMALPHAVRDRWNDGCKSVCQSLRVVSRDEVASLAAQVERIERELADMKEATWRSSGRSQTGEGLPDAAHADDVPRAASRKKRKAREA